MSTITTLTTISSCLLSIHCLSALATQQSAYEWGCQDDTDSPSISLYSYSPNFSDIERSDYTISLSPLEEREDHCVSAYYYQWSTAPIAYEQYTTLFNVNDASDAHHVFYMGSNGRIADGEDYGTLSHNYIAMCSEYSSESEIANNYGAAIHRSAAGSSILAIEGDFIDNESGGEDVDAYAGAIYNSNGSVIGKITGHFVSNYACGVDRGYSAYGGAIVNEGEGSKLENITGDFLFNYSYSHGASASYGGAIYQRDGGSIGTLRGDFIANHALSTFHEGSAYGGAIYLENSSIEHIEGDFYANSAFAGVEVRGGAIFVDKGSQISTIKADFFANAAKVTFGSGSAYGGAIYNEGTIGSLTGDFIANYLQSRGDDVHGGAIYNSGQLTLDAREQSMTVSGNYVLRGADATRVNEGIYNVSDSKDSSVISFVSGLSNSIVINDIISGAEGQASQQILKIGDEEHSAVVSLNNRVENQTIIVNRGVLELGSYEGSSIVPSSSALLVNSALNIQGGSVTTTAEKLGVGNSIVNNGTLNLGSGTLSSDISGVEGHIILDEGVHLQLADGVQVVQQVRVTGQGNTVSSEHCASEAQFTGSFEVDAGALTLSQLSLGSMNVSVDGSSSLVLDQVAITENISIIGEEGSCVLLENSTIEAGVEFFLRGGKFDMESDLLGPGSRVVLEDVTLTNAASISTSSGMIQDSDGNELGEASIFLIDSKLSNHTLSLLGELNIELELSDDLHDLFLDSLTSSTPLALSLGDTSLSDDGLTGVNLSVRGQTYSLAQVSSSTTGDLLLALVPEPSSSALTLLALSLASLRRRRAR